MIKFYIGTIFVAEEVHKDYEWIASESLWGGSSNVKERYMHKNYAIKCLLKGGIQALINDQMSEI